MFMPPYGGANFPYKTNLNWIVEQIKNALSAVTKLGNEMENIQNELDNIDSVLTNNIQNAVNSKLDSWIADGTLADMIAPSSAALYLPNMGRYSYLASAAHLPTNSYLNAALINKIKAKERPKILMIGDSILWGSNQMGFLTIGNDFAKNCPACDIVVQAIPGENVYDAANNSYILSDHYDQTTYSWIEIGKSWPDIIVDTAPTILIICFGMNTWGDGSFNYRNRQAFQTLINLCSTHHITPILMTPFTPTLNPALATTPLDVLYGTANAIREIANYNNAGLIDITPLSSALAWPYVNNVYDTITTSDMAGDYAYNFQFSIPIAANETKTAFIRRYKYNNIETYATIDFTSAQATVKEYYGTNVANTFTLKYTNDGMLKVDITGNIITINGIKGTLLYTYCAGAYDFTSLGTTALNIATYAKNDNYVANAIMVGPETNADSYNVNGNGINHPTAFALQSTYLAVLRYFANMLNQLVIYSESLLP